MDCAQLRSEVPHEPVAGTLPQDLRPSPLGCETIHFLHLGHRTVRLLLRGIPQVEEIRHEQKVPLKGLAVHLISTLSI